MSTHADHAVFISYARKGGASLAKRLQRDLAAKGFEVWLDTNRISGGTAWTVEIERAIDRSQVILALLTPDAYVSDICRAEQLRSLRNGKSVIPVLAQTGTDVPLHLETKSYRDFTTLGNYDAQFSLLLDDIRTGNNSAPMLEKFRTTYVTAPPLPRNYIERTEAVLNLRNAVISEDPGPSIALTALRGMGGIGKTILAQALSRDDVIQQAFPDGIIWSAVGKEPAFDLITRMREVCRALGGKPADKESELECINRYRTLLRDKAALVIVDDVWRVPDIEPYLAESPRSRLLFTTRNASISVDVGAEEHTADLLTHEQSRALLARWAGLQIKDLPAKAADLIDECARLPLALSMVGAMLRGKPAGMWERVHSLLRDADLEKIRSQFPNYPHTDLLRVIQVSVDALDEIVRQRYLALAVGLEDMPLPPAVQQTLWNVDESEALSTAEQFVGLSLAQREDDYGAIRLHDLQLDYVRAQHPDREALDLIHGAARLSSHVIGKDPGQFASQIVGRLLSHRGISAIKQFIDKLVEGAPKPWLQPLQPVLHPPGTSLVRTLEGHSGSVTGVAVSADGRRVVSASRDHMLKVWDPETGRTLHTLEGHSSYVNGATVSPDGQRAVSASSDNTLKVWDLETGRKLRVLKGHSGSVNGVAVNADGRRVVSGSSDGTLKVWDLETGLVLRTLQGHSGSVAGVAVSADGRRAVSAFYDKTLKVWDLEADCSLHSLKDHSGPVLGVAVSADGRRAVSASRDKTLKVWDLETGHKLRTLTGHSDAVNGVALSVDGQWAVSASSDNTLKVWDLETGRELHTLQGHSDPVFGVAVSADGRRAVSASRDKTLKVWDLVTGGARRALEGHLDVVNGVAVSADGRRAVSASWDTTLKVWDLETRHELRTLEGHSDIVNGVAVSADGRRAVSASWDETLKVWDLETGHELHTLNGHLGSVTGVAVSGDGRRAVSASRDKTLKVWDLETRHELRTLRGHSDIVNGVAVSADGRRAVSASWDKTLKVWDLETGHELRTLTGHLNWVSAVAVSPDCRRAVSASWDSTLKVWDLETGRVLHTLEGHSSFVTDVAFSVDARRVVSASDDKTLRVWDLETGLPFAAFTCDGRAVSCVFIGNNKIFAGDSGGLVHFLSLEETETQRPNTPT